MGSRHTASVSPIRRDTARVIPVSPQGRALLLYGHDPDAPQRPYWFTVGGQIEPPETARQAVVRELQEETGIVIDGHDLIGPFHRGQHAYSYAGAQYVSTSQFFTLLLTERNVRPAGVPGEVITDARWWSPEEIKTAPLSGPGIPEIVALAVTAATRRC